VEGPVHPVSEIRERIAKIAEETYQDEYGHPLDWTFEDIADAILEEFDVTPKRVPPLWEAIKAMLSQHHPWAHLPDEPLNLSEWLGEYLRDGLDTEPMPAVDLDAVADFSEHFGLPLLDWQRDALEHRERVGSYIHPETFETPPERTLKWIKDIDRMLDRLLKDDLI
jgi:hypothetical protein